jgi:hypothetical protein
LIFDQKHYAAATKYRCVLRLHFEPAYAHQRKMDEMAESGLTPGEAAVLAGPRPPIQAAEALIDRALSYTFDPSRAGRYVPGRFNTANFSALYTAREASTAEAERRHHWFAGTQDAPFVVFSISFTGRARDIRPGITAGQLVFPEEYEPTQQYAREAIDAACEAIAAPSKRDLRGSCCAIFRVEAVTPGDVESVGSFLPA